MVATPFQLLLRHQTGARVGRLTTAHGTVHTPAFMPIATKGAVRGLPTASLADLQRQIDPTTDPIVLSNTYHLLLRPGGDQLRALGGARALMHWPGVMLTDSGGFQIFSLSRLRNIDADGVTFQSHIDGRAIRITPEDSMETQSAIASSIWMCLDWFPGFPASDQHIRESVDRTTVWAQRCRTWHQQWRSQDPQHQSLLFGIVQGGLDRTMRQESAAALQAIGFDGYAIGGLAVGEPPETMLDTAAFTARLLPDQQIRYLMGVGTPDQMLQAIRSGIDLFDCVLPTRNARHGSVFISDPASAGQLVDTDLQKVYYQKLPVTSAALSLDTQVLDPYCHCPTCSSGVSRAYIRHLFSVHEMVAMTYTTTHNVWFYCQLMAQIRQILQASL